jgi:hypothetical protein
MAVTLATTMPQPNAPFFDVQGNVSPVWLNWFLVIQNRTGGIPGGPSTTTLAEQIGALFVETAFADEVAPEPAVLLSMDAVFSDPQQPPPSPVLLPFALIDDNAPKPTVNPFIAAFFVGDVS